MPGPGRPPKPYAGRIYPLEQRIRVVCARLGLTPAGLGKRIRLSDEVIAGIIEENRKGHPRPGKVDTYWRIAQAAGVSVDWLLGESELPDFPGKS